MHGTATLCGVLVGSEQPLRLRKSPLLQWVLCTLFMFGTIGVYQYCVSLSLSLLSAAPRLIARWFAGVVHGILAAA